MSEHQPPEHNSDRNKDQHGPQHPEHDTAQEHEKRPAELHPRIWIGSLADYNNGTLTGEWVDAAVPDDKLIDAAKRVISSSETPDAEEWAIFDHDEFGAWKPDEYEYLSTVAQVARGIAEYGPAFAVWADLHDADPDVLAVFEDSYFGAYDSPADWAREVLGDIEIERRIETEFGEELSRYIQPDYEGWARDAWLGGEVCVCERGDGGVWVFGTNV